MVEGAKALAGVEEGFEDAEARLHVRLAPFTRCRVPVFHGCDAGASHGEVGGVEDVAGRAVDIFSGGGAVSEAEDGEDGEVAAEGHGDAFGAAFLVGGGDAAEDAGPGLSWLVVGGYGFVG